MIFPHDVTTKKYVYFDTFHLIFLAVWLDLYCLLKPHKVQINILKHLRLLKGNYSCLLQFFVVCGVKL